VDQVPPFARLAASLGLEWWRRSSGIRSKASCGTNIHPILVPGLDGAIGELHFKPATRIHRVTHRLEDAARLGVEKQHLDRHRFHEPRVTGASPLACPRPPGQCDCLRQDLSHSDQSSRDAQS
jgi:hypothetical protein